MKIGTVFNFNSNSISEEARIKAEQEEKEREEREQREREERRVFEEQVSFIQRSFHVNSTTQNRNLLIFRM